ncbi:MAG: lysophospholipid acyltransferase family protein [Verrucomicrobiae bacterium]|nr:lysophospholipid acyltransferase family protein [Verrucomicrobiae bacterium]
MPESPTKPRSFLHRFSAYGDLTLKFQAWGARVCPPYLEPLFIAFYSSVFFLVAAPIRRALMTNLKVLFPEKSATTRFLDAYRIVWNFSFTVADATRARHGESIIDWELEGVDHLEAISTASEGAVLLTAHMGNYDVAAPLFAQKLKRPFNAVRAPERHPETQEWMEQQLATHGSEHYRIRYNKDDRLLGLELVQAISRGEVVAIQGDRVMFDVAPFPLDLAPSGVGEKLYRFRLPKGPFVLAQVTGAPIYPVFILRTGWRRYRVKALPPFHCRVESRDREAAVEKAARHWVDDILMPVIREHWTQWFVFEPAFEPTDS